MYSMSVRVRYSESDSQGRLTEVALLDYLQDCAIFHSEDIGYGVEYMAELNVAWVLGSWQIDMQDMPKFGENIVIETYPYKFKGFVGCRCFIVKSADLSKEYARANSVWSYIDMNSMKPGKVPADMVEGYGVEPKIEMDYSAKKLRPEPDSQCMDMPMVTIGRQHIDTNNHVNNGQYVRIASEYIQELMPGNQRIKQIKAEYKRQVHLGDVLLPKVYITDASMLVVYESEDGNICTNIEFSF